MKILRGLAPFAIYFSIATILAQALGVAVLWRRGRLTRETAGQMWAVLYRVDLEEMREKIYEEIKPQPQQQIAYAEVARARRRLEVDLDMREAALEMAVMETRFQQMRLQVEKNNFKNISDWFTRQLGQQPADGESPLAEVQRNIQAMRPKQAKDQLLRILDGGPPESSMEEVVRIVRWMPIDKRKKILGEFRNAEDADKLAAILAELRSGAPDTGVIFEAREKLKTLSSAPAAENK